MIHTFYADDTYAKSSTADEPQAIHLFGGIVVSRDCEEAMIESIREVKKKYTHPNMPVKWNFKDNSIKKKYEEFGKVEDYKEMLSHSRDWRLEVFQRINEFNYTVVVSCIEAFSKDATTIQKIKNDLNTYCFENVLMRVGLDAKEIGGHWQCVLDWPPENNSKPFDSGYYQLFHTGKASSPKPAICGPLEKLGFSHSLHFTRTNHSPLMQLADLVLGATRDHIECRMQGRESSVGTEAVNIFYDHFRNQNGEVPRYGVIPSTGNQSLSRRVAEIFKRKANISLQRTVHKRPPAELNR
jgi:hypothetical protein